jgi:hypothetical protein
MSGDDFESAASLLAHAQQFVLELSKADWNDAAGPMRLRGDLGIEELAGSPYLVNARVFVKALADEGGTDATATGNLNRAFVGRMFEQVELSETFRRTTQRVCKVINELDLWQLHITRIVCECAGLVKRRQKRFALTPLGRRLLPDAQAGTLYQTLFVAHFRTFNLSYDFHLRDVPGIQQTMAVVLWRIDRVARDWVPVHGLAPKILLPNVLKQLRAAMTYPLDAEEWILAGYALDPLLELGLIEKEGGCDEWPGCAENDRIRVTALWRRFISFTCQFEDDLKD